MFSFHRPKVYRSSTGCCICKAKSSSSRFTDSKKYEEDFLECFKLSTPRQGEICNACVLLVKRWKKLPAGSGRNWQHVVDARAGPGIKSMTKFKVKNKKHLEEKAEKIRIKKQQQQQQFDREYSPNLSDKSDGGNEESELTEMMDFLSEDGPSAGSSRAASPGGSDGEEAVVSDKGRRFKSSAKHRDEIVRISDFVDTNYWKRETVCCGTFFRGMFDEIMIDPRFIRPCKSRMATCKLQQAAVNLKKPDSNNTGESMICENGTTTTTKLYSDSSSDSGYDDCSNQGAPLLDAFKKDQVSIDMIHHHHHNRQIPKVN